MKNTHRTVALVLFALLAPWAILGWQSYPFITLSTIESLSKIVGIFGAGWWFIWRGMHRSRVVIEQEISRIPYDTEHDLLLVRAVIHNKGEIRVRLSDCRIQVSDIQLKDTKEVEPLDDRIITKNYDSVLAVDQVLKSEMTKDFCMKGFIEPHESEELCGEFPIRVDAKVLSVICLVKNPRSQGLSWYRTSYCAKEPSVASDPKS